MPPAITLASILENPNHLNLLNIEILGAEKGLWPTIEEYYRCIEYLVLEPHHMDGSEAWLDSATTFTEHNGLQIE